MNNEGSTSLLKFYCCYYYYYYYCYMENMIFAVVKNYFVAIGYLNEIRKVFFLMSVFENTGFPIENLSKTFLFLMRLPLRRQFFRLLKRPSNSETFLGHLVVCGRELFSCLYIFFVFICIECDML